jgi:HSP20 family molecular chaperone IbpA
MRCENCGSEVKEGWAYCPRCGAKAGNRGDIFSELMKGFEKQFREINKRMERDFEVMDLSPFFRSSPKGRGFSIKITRTNNEQPKIEVNKFGQEERKEIREDMPKMKMRTPKKTEEPKTDVRRIGDKILVEIHLPGVKSEEDIQVRSLENSVEIKAFSGDKAYFKILTKPDKAGVERKPFEDGVLRLIIS